MARVKLDLDLKDMERKLGLTRRQLLELVEEGAIKAAEDLVSRSQSLAPRDTGNLENSFDVGDPRRKRRAIVVPWGVSTLTIGGSRRKRPPISADDEDVETQPLGGASFDGNYGVLVHEGMVHRGGPAGIPGEPFAMRRSESTVAKRPEDPSDGEPGGQYMLRPMANRPERYGELISRIIREGGGA